MLSQKPGWCNKGNRVPKGKSDQWENEEQNSRWMANVKQLFALVKVC